ncbi:hypothetical protein MKJ01_01310 [Chryseobacterium sp. SSA4.19]|uniref:hypothetical protein n=1 Tax=Chryseobacterium sp. SSA4.19 TaxID=2919915 RepID=UPI001F4E832D|nr:hypothetical protein [Chryseobacterium sp. SSA4.19]MCJ8152396.1 hypothetical protein [Chryseobacterium sp. SSA4.19]
MRNLILLIMPSASLFLSAQQTEGLKTEKTTRASIMERKLPEKSKDSIAKNNVNNLLKQKSSSSFFGTTQQYNSDVQMNVNRLQNNVNTFNNNSFNRMLPQGQGIEIKKRK